VRNYCSQKGVERLVEIIEEYWQGERPGAVLSIQTSPGEMGVHVIRSSLRNGQPS
jgi:hypothetical protein